MGRADAAMEDEDFKPRARAARKTGRKRRAVEEDEDADSVDAEEDEDEEHMGNGANDDDDDDDDEDDEEGDDDFASSSGRGRASGAKRKRASTASSAKRTATKKEAKTAMVQLKIANTPIKQLELAMQAHKWWEDPQPRREEKWKTLEHNGVMFPPPYKSHGVKLFYDGEPVELTPEQEEVATLYAEVPLDGPMLNDPEKAKLFNKNFFEDFRKVLGKGHRIKIFDRCDFSALRAHVEREREARKNLSKEDKVIKKKEADAQRLVFSFALVDGHLQKVGNVMVEPPGLFRGRGFHPKMGRLKKRVMPEQITINIGEHSPVPPCPLPGHSWGNIVHKHDVTWLAYWKENVLNGTKYVWLAASSGFKGKADMEKYEKARRLKNKIKLIRNDYEKKLSNRDVKLKQLGTAMWVIDRLALRVGNEKDDDEADTVGCCSLRVEHVTVDRVNQKLTLDFLGKDSMRHHQDYEVVAQYGAVGQKVLKNFELFLKGKSPTEEVFDKLDVSFLNDHLKTLMPGLSAKVFRTMNASTTLQETLPHKIDVFSPDPEKVLVYNDANRQVALLCNHQKTVSNAAQSSIAKLSDNIEMLKVQQEEMRQMLKRRLKGKDIKTRPELPKDAANEDKKKISHLFTRQPRPEDVERRIENWEKKIRLAELQFQNKDDNKSVALGTSKINYMDPRITVAWCKRNELPIERVFATTLRDKFPWAMSVPESFVW